MYIKRKTETEQSKIIDEYMQLKRFHHDCQLKMYMYNFMYVNPDTMPVEDHFPDTKNIVVNYKNMSTPGTVPKYWSGFSYIRSEYYELDQNFDDT